MSGAGVFWVSPRTKVMRAKLFDVSTPQVLRLVSEEIPVKPLS